MTESRIVVVNTGSTSTKCSIYHGEGDHIIEEVSECIRHPDDLVHRFPTIADQLDHREELVRGFLEKHLPDRKCRAMGAIGGMLPPVPSGVIEINDELAHFSHKTPVYQHASNLAAPLIHRLKKDYQCPVYAVDPVGVDEMAPIARISGAPDFPRFSFVHALNIRATTRKLAAQLGRRFEEMRVVACHLGGGYSIAPVVNGRIVDSDNRMEGAPFTPERAGGVPPIPLLEACFSGKYTKQELHKKLYGAGGLYAYLGTKDIKEVVRRIAAGDSFAKFIYDAMIYQICKEVGAMASVLDFDIDGIIVTGGVANEKYLSGEIVRKCSRLGKVYLFPGENENEASAESVWRVITGKEQTMRWPDCIMKDEDIDPLWQWRKNR